MDEWVTKTQDLPTETEVQFQCETRLLLQGSTYTTYLFIILILSSYNLT